MYKKDSSIGILEYINLALAIFSWLFSDIDFYMKVIITTVLIGIVVLSKFQLVAWLRNLTIKPIMILFGYPIVVSVATYYLASLCYSEDLLKILFVSNPLPLSLVYSLLIGLPTVIIGATSYKFNLLGFNWGLFFGFLWFYLIFELTRLGQNFDVWKVSVLGPIGYAYIGDKCGLGHSDSLPMILVTVIGVYLVPLIFYYYGKIWRTQNDLNSTNTRAS